MSAQDSNVQPSYAATLADGSRVTVLAFDGAVLRFVGERAHPPGRPLELSIELGDETLAVQGKAVGSKLRDDARFDVRLRLNSLRREARALLERHFSHPPR
jgi:hypothetical protein